VGRILDWATFMLLRTQRPVIPDEPDDFDALSERSRTDVDLADFLGEDARFGIGLHVPDCRLTWELGDDGYLETLWLLAPDAWASPRTGYLLPIEDGQWMVALMGAGGQHPPTDEDGFAAFTRSLRQPIIADVLAAAKPLTPIRGHRGTANRLWHYERMRRWPERFIVLGDAVCAFNPIYGQGMSTAAVAAETLDTCLREQRRRRTVDDLDGLARRCQRRLARRNADPWMLSTGEDLRYPTTGARVSAVTRLQYRYLDRVLVRHHPGSRHCRHLHAGPWPARPTSLFAPRVLAAAARTRSHGERAPSNSVLPARPSVPAAS
jgi:hypothetical protein